MICIGKVIGVDDKTGGDNIYTYINNIDNETKLTREKMTFPLLPKYIHTKPLKGEYVVIIALTGDKGENLPIQRFYVGPIISQRQFMEGGVTENGALSTTNLTNNVVYSNINNSPNTEGSFGNEDEINIYGRKGTDILLGNNDLRIRCGARLDDSNRNGKTFKFNTVDPAFIQMKYYPKPLTTKMKVWDSGNDRFKEVKYDTDSVSVLSAQNILLAPSDTILTEGKSNMITDERMAEILSSSHPLIYGDQLVSILKLFRDAINTHVHDWGPSPANDHPTDELNKLNQVNFGEMISDNVRITS